MFVPTSDRSVKVTEGHEEMVSDVIPIWMLGRCDSVKDLTLTVKQRIRQRF